ncbi:transposable element Tcb2 transposase [Trichonephila clavipes]|nr:transposable element Tcb2 transposase [Trichonephila clavipes]
MFVRHPLLRLPLTGNHRRLHRQSAMKGEHGQWNGTTLCLLTNLISAYNITMVGFEFGDTVAGRRAVLLVRWIVRSVPLEIVGSSGHEKVPTRGKPGLERRGIPRGERNVRQALVDPTVTRSMIRPDVGVAIVPQTIYRHLAETNLKSMHPFRALPLTPEHRQLRLQWCQTRSMWNVTYWQKVVFSDESRFVLETDDNHVRVWRRPGERYNSPHTVLRHTARTGHVMVWGAIAYDSQSTLIGMRGTLMGQRYVDDILRPHVGPFLNGLQGAILQRDNARPHTARIAKDFLRHFQTSMADLLPRFVPCRARVGSAKTVDAIVTLFT